jgi:alpha-beta hydrolase superfamily lysophospholipase
VPRSVPILMLSGAKDMIVPSSEMHALWELASRRGEKRSSVEIEREPLKDVFESLPDGDHGMSLHFMR